MKDENTYIVRCEVKAVKSDLDNCVGCVFKNEIDFEGCNDCARIQYHIVKIIGHTKKSDK